MGEGRNRVQGKGDLSDDVSHWWTYHTTGFIGHRVLVMIEHGADLWCMRVDALHALHASHSPLPCHTGLVRLTLTLNQVLSVHGAEHDWDHIKPLP